MSDTKNTSEMSVLDEIRSTIASLDSIRTRTSPGSAGEYSVPENRLQPPARDQKATKPVPAQESAGGAAAVPHKAAAALPPASPASPAGPVATGENTDGIP